MSGPSGEAFLANGGEIGTLMRSLDWTKTALPAPDSWPQALRAAVRLILTSGHPMYIWWGSELACLYNDAYSSSIGPERHPSSLGQPGREVWGEIWPIIGPQIEYVLRGEGAIWQENALVPITRNGKREDVYWTYSFSPIDDPTAPNGVGGILVVCAETTKSVESERNSRLTGERFTRLFEQSPNFMTVLRGPDHIFEYCNPAYVGLIGRNDLIGKAVKDALPEAVEQGFLTLLDDVLASGEPFRASGMSIALVPPGGGVPEERILDFVYQPIVEADGLISGIFVEGFEITDRHRAEQGLRDGEEQLRLATEHADIGMWDVDLIRQTRYWTARTKAMYGLPAEAAVTFEDFEGGLHPEDHDRVLSAFAAATDPDRKTAYDEEYRVIGADGVVRWVAAKGKAIFGDDGQALRVIGTAIDITEKKKAERRREALIDLTDIIRTAEIPGEIAFAAGRIIGETLSVSRVGMGALSPNRASLRIGKDWVAPGVKSLTGDASLVGADAFLHALDEGRVVRIDDVYLDAMTQEIAADWDAVSARAVVNLPIIDRGKLVSLFFVNDAEVRQWSDEEIDFISEIAERTHTAIERLRSESALRALNTELKERVDEALAEKRLLAEIVETTDAFIQVADLDFNWLAINRASADEFQRIFGVRPRAGDNMLTLLSHMPEHQAAVKEIWSHALSGEEFTSIGEFGSAENERRYYEMKFNALRDGAGSLIGAYQFVYDVTERLRDQERLSLAEEQLRQAQKMEAVGQLTGGVAHDFNNMLAVVIGSLELLTRRLVDDPRSRHYATSALEAARRSATLTQRLLAFSRQQPLRPESINPNKLVSGMSDLLSHALSGAVRLETVLAAGVWNINVDANQLENVIVNLGVNARDAMPAGGKVTIETQNVHFDTRYVALEPGLSPGQYVMIAVTDTGTGMPPEVIAKAFDPFFTTKEIGKGTGLGLSQAYGFVKQSGGHVRIYSEPGHGTTVKIYLPRHHAADSETSADAAPSEFAPGEDSEVILVVDDEKMVRQFSVDAISDLGYRVIEADSAATAMQLLSEHPEIALVFTDIVMPETNGRVLADQVKALRPDIKILFTTGYTRNAVVHNGVLDPGVELIGKPFSIDELSAKLRVMLDAK